MNKQVESQSQEESASAPASVLSDGAREHIDHWLTKFEPDQRRGALIAALMHVQKENHGHLTEALMRAVGDYIGLPYIAVYEVATFYSMFDHQKVGSHKIYLCTNISCQLRGVDAIAKRFKERLGVEFGGTTDDGQFTLKEFECLGACTRAPACLVDETYHEHLTPESVDTLIDELSKEGADD